jgi:23S rRNA pseudouridine2605 synthase
VLRLQKYLADAGVASRRASEQIILAGRVSLNGTVVRELGVRIDPDHDKIALDGRPLKTRRKLHVALHKPEGVVCTRSDPQGRRTVGDFLPREWEDLYPVGRLDYDSEGLLLLTNDGDFCLKLTHPRYGVPKRYLVQIEGAAPPALTRKLEKGVMNEEELLKASRARVVSSNADSSQLEITLVQGRNREIRRMLETLGHRVLRLVRVQIGNLHLGELKKGKWRVLQPADVASLSKT